MIYIGAALAFLLSCCTLNGQPSNDSLVNLLNHHPQEDTVRLNLLSDLAFEYNYTDPDKGLQVSDELITLATKLDNEVKLASGYSHKGVNYAAKGEDSMALIMYAQALAIHTKLENSAGMARVFNNIAIVQVGRARYAEALEYYRKCYSILEQLGDQPRMANALNNTGVVYLYLADYPKALEYYLKALSILDKTDNDVGRANNLSNIGIIYKNLSEYTKAIEYHEKALRLYEKSGNTHGLAITLSNIGVVYDLMKEPSRALQFYQQSLALNNQLGNKKRIANDMTNIGVVHHGLGDYETAMDHFQRALDLYETTGDKNSTIIALNQLGNLFSEAPDSLLTRLGTDKKSRHKRSLGYLESSLTLAREVGAADRLSETWLALCSTYVKQHDYENAFNAYRQHILFRDSALNVENQKKVVRNEMQFEFEKKELLASAEMKRERLMRNIILVSSALLLVAAIASFVFYKIKTDAEKRKNLAEYRADMAATEMKVLRLQMNPHFIFNSLNAIGDFILRNNTAEADRYLTKFARLMRDTLEHSEQAEVSLAADLETLKLYMDLEALRLDKKFTYQIAVDPSIDRENTLIPPLLLQPFVENSILHGLAGKREGGDIAIRISAEQNTLVCVVEDNGVGMDAAAQKNENAGRHPGKSMGLRITKSRIEMMNKKHSAKAFVDISSTAAGTRATITLPLQLNF